MIDVYFCKSITVMFITILNMDTRESMNLKIGDECRYNTDILKKIFKEIHNITCIENRVWLDECKPLIRVTTCDLSTKHIDTNNFLYRDSLKCIGMEGDIYDRTPILSYYKRDLKLQKITNLESCFSYTDFTKLNLNTWDTKYVTNMKCMFENTYKLKQVFVDKWITNNVKSMERMFSNCSKLENIDISNFVINSDTDINNMFYGCKSIKSLNLSSCNSDNNYSKMLNKCKNLDLLTIPNSWSEENELSIRKSTENTTFINKVSTVTDIRDPIIRLSGRAYVLYLIPKTKIQTYNNYGKYDFFIGLYLGLIVLLIEIIMLTYFC